MDTHCILGFDVRVDPSIRDAPSWHQESRLNPLLPSLLSVDPDCWPRPESSEALTTGIVRPWQTAHYFTGDIRTYVDAYLAKGISIEGSVGAAFTISTQHLSIISDYYGDPWVEISLCPSGLLFEGWTFCGFDCANLIDLVSALKAFGYTAEDRTVLADLSDDLNNFGLFKHEGASRRFGEKRGEVVTEHSPFHPVGIYLKSI